MPIRRICWISPWRVGNGKPKHTGCTGRRPESQAAPCDGPGSVAGGGDGGVLGHRLPLGFILGLRGLARGSGRERGASPRPPRGQPGSPVPAASANSRPQAPHPAATATEARGGACVDPRATPRFSLDKGPCQSLRKGDWTRPDIRDDYLSLSEGRGLWRETMGGCSQCPMAIKSFAFAEDWQVLEPLRCRGRIPAVES